MRFVLAFGLAVAVALAAGAAGDGHAANRRSGDDRGPAGGRGQRDVSNAA